MRVSVQTQVERAHGSWSLLSSVGVLGTCAQISRLDSRGLYPFRCFSHLFILF